MLLGQDAGLDSKFVSSSESLAINNSRVRDPSSVDKQMINLQKEQIECATLKLDMGDISSIELAVDSLKKETSCLDVLVNNAGTFEEDWGTLPSELDFADLKRTFDVNFFGPYRLTQLLVPIIKKSPQGRIVNISSDMGSLEELMILILWCMKLWVLLIRPQRFR